MRRDDALALAQDVVAVLQPFCERIEIAGSLRRGKAEVGDIDLVVIPKAGRYFCGLGFEAEFSADKVWAEKLPSALCRKVGAVIEASGPELIRCSIPSNEDPFQVDVYRARPETWGVMLLVKTGSKEHNVKLCSLALSKGLRLSAAQGVLRAGQVVASRTEEEIFRALGLAFVEPKDREVPS